MFTLNISTYATETSSAMYNWYGSIYGASGTPFNINNNVQKRTASYMNSFSYLVPAGRYLNSINFIGATDTTFSKGNTYEINVDIVCGFEPLAEFDFYEGYLTETHFNNLTALQLRDEFDQTFSIIKAPNIQSSLTLVDSTEMPQYTYKLTILYRPLFSYDTLGLAICMLNQSDVQSTLIMAISSIEGVSDIDGDYYQKRSAELLEEGNAILGDISDGIDDVNDNLTDVNDGISDVNDNLTDIGEDIKNAPQNEYDYSASKNDELDVNSSVNDVGGAIPTDVIGDLLGYIDDFISDNSTATKITFPSAKLPTFAGGYVLWNERTIELGEWINNKDISKLLIVIRVTTSITAVYSTAVYVFNLFNVNNTNIEEQEE